MLASTVGAVYEILHETDSNSIQEVGRRICCCAQGTGTD